MGLFGKQKPSEKVKKDRELISQNARAMDALIILAGDNAGLVQKLRDTQEKMNYLLPSDADKIYEYDKEIKRLVEDARIALTKSDGETNKKVENAILQIDLTISDRNVKI